MAETVSCIVPVHNGAAYLEQALCSILAQTHADIEVIVVDDGSLDATPAVVRRFDERVRYLRQTQSGPAAARNLGLSRADGRYVAFLDADDVWHPRKLEHQLAGLRQRPGAAACVACVREFSGTPPPGGVAGEPGPGTSAVPGYVSGALLACRRAFDQVGRYNPALRHGADLDWFLRARRHGLDVALIDEVLLFRRLHDANFSRREADRSRHEHLRVIREDLKRRRSTRP